MNLGSAVAGSVVGKPTFKILVVTAGGDKFIAYRKTKRARNSTGSLKRRADDATHEVDLSEGGPSLGGCE